MTSSASREFCSMFRCICKVQRYMGLHSVTQGYTALHRVTQRYTGLHRVTQRYTV